MYAVCTGRTDIDLADQMVAEVMWRFGVSTKKDAVDLVLRRLVGSPVTRDVPVAMELLAGASDENAP